MQLKPHGCALCSIDYVIYQLPSEISSGKWIRLMKEFVHLSEHKNAPSNRTLEAAKAQHFQESSNAIQDATSKLAEKTKLLEDFVIDQFSVQIYPMKQMTRAIRSHRREIKLMKHAMLQLKHRSKLQTVSEKIFASKPSTANLKMHKLTSNQHQACLSS